MIFFKLIKIIIIPHLSVDARQRLVLLIFVPAMTILIFVLAFPARLQETLAVETLLLDKLPIPADLIRLTIVRRDQVPVPTTHLQVPLAVLILNTSALEPVPLR